MFHSTTETLMDYWRMRKGARSAPLRSDIDPLDFPRLLPQVFIMGRREPGVYPMRLVGGLIVGLHPQDLRGANFLSQWSAADHHRLSLALEGARRRGEPVVIAAEGRAGRFTLDLEIMVAPLANPDGQIDRFIGLYQPLSKMADLHGRPLDVIALKAFAGANEAVPALRLAAVDGRLVG